RVDPREIAGEETAQAGARALAYHPDGAQARRRAGRRWLALLGDPGRDLVPSAASRRAAFPGRRRHRPLPAGARAEAGPHRAASVPGISGLALSRTER